MVRSDGPPTKGAHLHNSGSTRYSVVIACRNAARWLGDAIKSALRQTRGPAEVIVVDDASSDTSRTIVRELAVNDQRVKLWRLPAHQGVSVARNVGLRLSLEELVMFLDADDVIEPAYAEAVLDRLAQLEEMGGGPWVLVHGAYWLIDDEGGLLSTLPISWRQTGRHETFGYQLVRNHISTSGTMIRRDDVLAIGGFNETLVRGEDHDLWLRLAQRGGFAYVDQPMVRVRRHARNSSRWLRAMLDAEREILQQYEPDTIIKAVLNRDLPDAQNRADAASVLFRIDEWEKGFGLVQEGVRLNPNNVSAWFVGGVYHLFRRDWAAALSWFLHALTLDVNHAAALNNVGALRALKGDLNDARRMIEKALRLHPKYLDARYNLMLLEGTSSTGEHDWRFTRREMRPVLVPYQDV